MADPTLADYLQGRQNALMGWAAPPQQPNALAPYAPAMSDMTTPADLQRRDISGAFGWDVGQPGREFLHRLPLLLSAIGMRAPFGPGPTNHVPRASRNATIYDPPDRPQRPFEADYPAGSGVRADATGRLTHDIDGRPLVAERVVGRRVVGGEDQAIPPAEFDALTAQLFGAPSARVAQSQIRGDAGRYVSRVDPATGTRLREVLLNRDLTAQQAPRVYGHEIGHGIDDLAGTIPTTGLNTELRQVYNTLNNANRSTDGLEAASWGGPANPQGFGYSGTAIAREQMAEAIRAYMANPNYIKTVAPKTAARIREYVNANPHLMRSIQFNSLLAPVAASPWLSSSGDEPTR